MNTILGLDIGGTKTAVVLGDHDARIVHRTVFETRPERGFAATWAELRDHIATAQRRATELARTVDAVSVSIGGPLQIEPGIIKSPPNLPGWDDIPLKQLLADLTGLPVYIEHDGNAGALAEWLFGAARGARNVIFLTMGTGFGGGLILNGQLYRGTCDTAGEVGHVRIADDGPVGFGKAGSWEGLCAGARRREARGGAPSRALAGRQSDGPRRRRSRARRRCPGGRGPARGRRPPWPRTGHPRGRAQPRGDRDRRAGRAFG
jgi:glucokinase